MESLISSDLIGSEFIRQYYTVLVKSPENLHRFYDNNSTLTLKSLNGNQSGHSTVLGRDNIEKLIKTNHLSYNNYKINEITSEATLGNGIVIQVTGELFHTGTRQIRKFIQTIVLALFSFNKYYIYNDILHSEDVDEEFKLSGEQIEKSQEILSNDTELAGEQQKIFKTKTKSKNKKIHNSEISSETDDYVLINISANDNISENHQKTNEEINFSKNNPENIIDSGISSNSSDASQNTEISSVNQSNVVNGHEDWNDLVEMDKQPFGSRKSSFSSPSLISESSTKTAERKITNNQNSTSSVTVHPALVRRQIRNLFVTRIPSHANYDKLRSVFSDFGYVSDYKFVASNNNTGKVAFISYDNAKSARDCLNKPIYYEDKSGKYKLHVEVRKSKTEISKNKGYVYGKKGNIIIN